ncbi:hypothetical protein [Rodentibacter trehalosifermentans]|uniref:Uncharacterized protein n=2 Tax=Rodentibacter trehalosifermentans TaxID=1908263 RepID=A0A1V3IV54_9PAST|nr:hypothetical protein [Rodentibacter trehalosifermentans]OOF45944.1 hypothetical protein BKK51_04600 [Rodentibacter trehalosifermentans]OOF47966.1 hypothetical protein BKK53_10635 [Rodentibacter trehalosifermentans]
MEILEKKRTSVIVELSKKEIQLIVSALGEIPNILDVDDCETRTGYKLDDFDHLFYEMNILDER